MIIAGLTGGIGHGKTTFAQLLAQSCTASVHFETWEIVAEVATALHYEHTGHPNPDDLDAINECLLPLPDVVKLHTHTDISFENIRLTPERLAAHPEHFEKLFEHLRNVQANPDLIHEEITEANKEKFRPLLQWLGGYLVAIGGNGIWYDELIRRITHIKNNGYELVTVGGVRYPGDAERIRNAGGSILSIQRPQMPEQDTQDLTERQRALIKPDSVVLNDGSLEDLTACARLVQRDLSLRQLKPEYSASSVATTTYLA